MITATEAKQRISNMQAMLRDKGLDGALFIFAVTPAGGEKLTPLQDDIVFL